MMRKLNQKWLNDSSVSATLCLVVGLTVPSALMADEADAKRLMKAMSDHLVSQHVLSFDYDSSLEVVTTEGQKLSLASSGMVQLKRPDKIHATRVGGFVNTESFFDGKVLTLVGKNINAYSQVAEPGTLDNLLNVLRTEYARPIPGGNLLLSNPVDAMMLGVTDIKDLGTGVIGGVECDHLAFRQEHVDWQIWIAHGESPYPCQYSVTTHEHKRSPQYTIRFSNWQSGNTLTTPNFSFKNSTGAKEVKLNNLKGTGDLPPHFTMGETK
jgi:hypothetical protein